MNRDQTVYCPRKGRTPRTAASSESVLASFPPTATTTGNFLGAPRAATRGSSKPPERRPRVFRGDQARDPSLSWRPSI